MISLLLDWLRDKKKGFHTIKKGLVGTWKSTSFDQKNEKWVEDEIDITLALGKICLKNLNPDLCGGYNYGGSLKFVDRRHLFGRWQSVKGSSTIAGSVFFVLDPDGEYLYGFYNYDDDGKWSGWCLGRSVASLKEATSILTVDLSKNAEFLRKRLENGNQVNAD